MFGFGSVLVSRRLIRFQSHQSSLSSATDLTDLQLRSGRPSIDQVSAMQVCSPPLAYQQAGLA
jgi:hypothetical protein